MKKIGIIGGMGASAGVRILSNLIKECQKRGATNDSDFPEIIFHNIPAEGMDETGIYDPTKIKKQINKSIKLMNDCGVEIISIACNTVHLYHEEFQENSTAEIINMVDLVAKNVKGNIGVISSSTTKKTCLYENAITKHGNKVIQISDNQQKKVDEIIFNVISGNDSVKDFQNLNDIYLSLKSNGADSVILGCTELPIALGKAMRKDEYIDPSKFVIERLLA